MSTRRTQPGLHNPSIPRLDPMSLFGPIDQDDLQLLYDASITESMLQVGRENYLDSKLSPEKYVSSTHDFRLAVFNFYKYKDNYDNSSDNTTGAPTPVEDWRMIYYPIKYAIHSSDLKANAANKEWRDKLLEKASRNGKFVYTICSKDGANYVEEELTEAEYVSAVMKAPYSMAMQILYKLRPQTFNRPTPSSSNFHLKNMRVGDDKAGFQDGIAMANFGDPCPKFCPGGQSPGQ